MFANVTETTCPVSFDVRIQSVAVWNLEGKSLALVVYDYMMEVNKTRSQKPLEQSEVLDDIVDARTDGNVPTCGYRWPLAHQSHVLTNDSDLPREVFRVIAPNGSNVFMHIHMLWRPSITPYAPVTFATSLDKIASQSIYIRKIVDERIPNPVYSNIISGTKCVPTYNYNEGESSLSHDMRAAPSEQTDVRELLGMYDKITQLVSRISVNHDVHPPPDEDVISLSSTDVCSEN